LASVLARLISLIYFFLNGLFLMPMASPTCRFPAGRLPSGAFPASGFTSRFALCFRAGSVAFVALAGFDFGLGTLPPVRGQGSADIVGLNERRAQLVAAHIPFIGAGVDQFAFACHVLESLLRRRRRPADEGDPRRPPPLRPGFGGWGGRPKSTAAARRLFPVTAPRRPAWGCCCRLLNTTLRASGGHPTCGNQASCRSSGSTRNGRLRSRLAGRR
jgi:hypothetical protein